MSLDSQAQARFVGEVIYLITGTIFIVVGVMALVVAAIRRRSAGVLAVLWLGIWSLLYGIQRLNDCSFMIALLPHRMRAAVAYSHAFCSYLVLVAGLLTFRELSTGKLRRIVTFLALTALLIAIFGVGYYFFSGNEQPLLPLNSVVAAIGLAVLLVFILVPRLSQRNFLIANRGIVMAGTIIFAVEALITNLVRPFGYYITAIWGDLGFLVFLAALSYAAMERVYSSERRLSSIENELAIARQLQFSILPPTTPDVRNLRVAAVYEPMTAVAGDFYEFLPVDDYRSGFLVADVSGHGVPAALIASMIKVAAQSLVNDTADPSKVLQRLGEILSGQLRGQFVSAAYLYMDVELGVARYSAAGHPPLLAWCAGCQSLQRIESNGPLFGTPCTLEFPVREVSFASGDRFLLYTDGLSEPENLAGEAFGDYQVEEVLRKNKSLPASELSLLLLNQVRAWPPASTPQQDDITFLLIDAL